MVWRPDLDERVAVRLEDLASSLDAGLDADAILAGGDAGAWSRPVQTPVRSFVAGLAESGLPLSDSERAILEAAESAGALPAALRGRAEARRQRAQLTRELIRRLSYPAVLLGFGAIVFTFVGGALGTSLLVPAVIVGLAIALVVHARRLFSDPGRDTSWVPGLAAMARDAGVVPYLDVMEGAYGAGIPVDRAHRLATSAVPVASVKARLFLAQAAIDGGQTSFVDALGAVSALDTETLGILRSGEPAGELESALRRAAERRRHTLGARSAALVGRVGVGIYILVTLWIGFQIIDFYTNRYAGLLGR